MKISLNLFLYSYSSFLLLYILFKYFYLRNYIGSKNTVAYKIFIMVYQQAVIFFKIFYIWRIEAFNGIALNSTSHNCIRQNFETFIIAFVMSLVNRQVHIDNQKHYQKQRKKLKFTIPHKIIPFSYPIEDIMFIKGSITEISITPTTADKIPTSTGSINETELLIV